MSLNRPAIVAVPVRDEAERIGPCLRALAFQHGASFTTIVLAINNTTDSTEQIVNELRPHLPVPVISLVQTLPPGQACAGAARRLAMEHAAQRLDGTDGVLFTTDADGLVPPHWLADNLRHVSTDVEAVAGHAALFPEDEATIPERLRTDDALETAYGLALDEIDSLLDPLPWDPWPRHTEHSGASIAVTLAAYRRAGGMPAAHLAEDRQFFDALRCVDARIRHAPDVAVTVSGRIHGRAEGGMADTIRRRLNAPDPYLDTALEPARLHVRRASLRQEFRRCWHGTSDDRAAAQAGLAAALRLPESDIAQAWPAPWFGEAWAGLERNSPTLARRPVPAANAGRETDEAQRILRDLRKSSTSFIPLQPEEID